MNLTDVERDIAAYFTSVHDEAGSSPLGVGWNGEASQRIRFEQLCKIINSSLTTARKNQPRRRTPKSQIETNK